MSAIEETGQQQKALSQLRTPLKLQQAESIWVSLAAKRYCDRFLSMGATQSTLLNLTNIYCLPNTWQARQGRS